jgi:ribosomal protein S18 acetylase RimI-like enzyme
MAVEPTHRGEGLGHRLGVALLDEFSNRGVSAVKVVVGSANETAIRAYEKMQFIAAGTTQVHPGETSQVMVWSA